MVATEISNHKTEPPVRAGVIDVDLAAVAALRDYVLAADRYAEAKKAMDAARAALDQAAGTHAEVTHADRPAFRFKPHQRRTANLDRLATRHPTAYADVVDETTSYRLDIDTDLRTLLRPRTWRAALRRLST
jgi:hypothetical protein